MLFSSAKKGTVFIIIFSFLVTLLILPTNGYAKWDDKSDELPGLYSISTETLILVGVGTAVLMYFLLKSSKKPDTKSDEEKKQQKETEADSSNASFNSDKLNRIIEFNNLKQFVSHQESKFSVLPIFDVQNEPVLYTAYGKSKNGLVFKVGLTLNF